MALKTIELTEKDELKIESIAKGVIKDAVGNVNQLANSEATRGTEPRYYLQLEIKAGLREFQRRHHIHLGDKEEKMLKKNALGLELDAYLHKALVALVTPHFESGNEPNSARGANYIRYRGGEDTTKQIPGTLERAFAAYRKGVALDRLHEVTVSPPPTQGRAR